MFAVYAVVEDAFGQDVVMVGDVTFETETEAADYMAEIIADDIAECGIQLGEYFVDEID